MIGLMAGLREEVAVLTGGVDLVSRAGPVDPLNQRRHERRALAGDGALAVL